MRALAPFSLVIALGAIAGCARGGGEDRDDARVGPRDGGPGIDAPGAGGDSGPPIEIDSGVTPEIDSGGPPRTDSGPIGTDSGPSGCTSAAECSDGMACNGIERCEGMRCVAGTAMACDDGVACTTDSCVEPGTCAYSPVDTMCPAGQRCTATGCSTTMTMCPESPCRLVGPQCGCAMGQACYLAGATRVCATAGAGTEGGACTGSANCAAGLDCINFSAVAGMPATQCARYCAGDADCMGIGSLCLQELGDGSGGTIPGVRVCTRACNPIRQIGCAPGLMCNVYREAMGAMRYLTDCTGPVGVGRAGAACTMDTQCAAGFACISNMCLHWCNVATDEGCSLAEICSPLTPAVMLGGVEYGVCL